MAEETNGLRRSAIVLLSMGEQHAGGDSASAEVKMMQIKVRAEMERVGALRAVSLKTRQTGAGGDFLRRSIRNDGRPKSRRRSRRCHNAGTDSVLDTISRPNIRRRSH